MKEYNEMTPHELNLQLQVHADREKALGMENITMAYLTAGWSRASKLPNLKNILSKLEQQEPKKKKRVHTPEQMLEFAKMVQAEYEESRK
ncbi:hypothetical protein [Paenibacillus ehimensis]|uniref:hypothetical protein n=1 Tax=Paenibacillus ehimensis TaxID=79264 RepID=UPI0004706F55|nr:hypothetical protein [Paenibacillus ehimensis]